MMSTLVYKVYIEFSHFPDVAELNVENSVPLDIDGIDHR